MLRWRFLLGTLIIAALVGLCWLDMTAPWPGLYLMPLAAGLGLLASRELLELAAAARIRPLRWTVYLGNLLVIAGGWGLSIGGLQTSVAGGAILPLFLIFAAVMLVLLGEMGRYRQPGGTTANVAAGVFAIIYIGVMLWFAVQLRVLWGIGAIASWVIVVKMGDTGAYFFGKLFGRHKMSPRISPGKTIEGAVGALVFATLGAWLAFRFVVPATNGVASAATGPWWGWIAFGVLVGAAGILGDLAESLLKRDAERKDSSEWMPGFGGVLDILDSLLLSAPVACFCWACGLV